MGIKSNFPKGSGKGECCREIVCLLRENLSGHKQMLVEIRTVKIILMKYQMEMRNMLLETKESRFLLHSAGTHLYCGTVKPILYV